MADRKFLDEYLKKEHTEAATDADKGEEKEYIYLDDLSVTAAYRNKGIGTALIQIAEDYAKKIKIGTVCLHVESENVRAFRLYKRLGYQILEEQGSRYLMVKKYDNFTILR